MNSVTCVPAFAPTLCDSIPCSDSAWSHHTSSSASSAALALDAGSRIHSATARSPTSEIKSAKRLIKEQPDAIYNCIKRLCKRIESDIAAGSPLPALDHGTSYHLANHPLTLFCQVR
jgi:hypothetical protein